MSGESEEYDGIFNFVINGENTQVVDARDMWEYLEIPQHFTTWINRRIKKYNFVENIDYVTNSKKMPAMAGPPLKNYYITLDMAIRLADFENNNKSAEIIEYLQENKVTP
jgi:phage anti-repressor protein